MANKIIMANIMEINDMNEIKRIIRRNIVWNPFYKYCSNERTLNFIKELLDITNMVKIPLIINGEKNTLVFYDDNVKLLNIWIEHWDSNHAQDKIAEISSQLIAEAIYLFKSNGKPPYFEKYKDIVIDSLSYDFETRKFLEKVFTI